MIGKLAKAIGSSGPRLKRAWRRRKRDTDRENRSESLQPFSHLFHARGCVTTLRMQVYPPTDSANTWRLWSVTLSSRLRWLRFQKGTSREVPG